MENQEVFQQPQSPATAPIRKLSVMFRRNRADDALGMNGINYHGYRAYWPSGSAVLADIARFCDKGVQILFDNNIVDEFCIDIYVMSVDGLEDKYGISAYISPESGLLKRRRRMYFQRHAVACQTIALYFKNGIKTDIEFELPPVTDPVILDWLTGDWWTTKTDQPLWVDILSVPKGQITNEFPVVKDFEEAKQTV